MHDWTLVSVLLEWKAASVSVILIDRSSMTRELIAHGFRGVTLRHDEPWGESVSILELQSIEPLANGASRLSIQMQSGDVFVLEADRFDIPT